MGIKKKSEVARSRAAVVSVWEMFHAAELQLVRVDQAFCSYEPIDGDDYSAARKAQKAIRRALVDLARAD